MSQAIPSSSGLLPRPLPKKGIYVEVESLCNDADAHFDVSVTSDCMGAAVLVYSFARCFEMASAHQLAAELGSTLLFPFGAHVGLIHLESSQLGRAIFHIGGRELRMTLLLGATDDARARFEAALFNSLSAFSLDPSTKNTIIA